MNRYFIFLKLITLFLPTYLFATEKEISTFSGKCLEVTEWDRIQSNEKYNKISNGMHVVMYDPNTCNATKCEIEIYSRKLNKEGTDTCFFLHKKANGKYVYGSLKKNSVLIRVNGVQKLVSLKIEKKK